MYLDYILSQLPTEFFCFICIAFIRTVLGWRMGGGDLWINTPITSRCFFRYYNCTQWNLEFLIYAKILHYTYCQLQAISASRFFNAFNLTWFLHLRFSKGVCNWAVLSCRTALRMLYSCLHQGLSNLISLSLLVASSQSTLYIER